MSITTAVPALVIGFTLLAGLASPPAQARDRQAEREYRELVGKLRHGDTDVDFDDLRFAHARTKAYRPYGGHERADAMNDAFQAREWKKAADLANAILDDNYVDGDAHATAMVAYGELGDEARSKFHRAVAQGLLHSICPPERGDSPRAPCRVISVGEEYFFLRSVGLAFESQATQPCGNEGERLCDVLHVKPKDGEAFDLYFDASLPMAWMAKELGK